MTQIIKTRSTKDDAYTYEQYDIIADGLTVGAAGLMVSDENAYLERLDVDEPYRCRGIGTDAIRLITAIHGSVYTAPDNSRSAHLCERMGRDVTGTDAAYYFDQGFGVYLIRQ